MREIFESGFVRGIEVPHMGDMSQWEDLQGVSLIMFVGQVLRLRPDKLGLHSEMTAWCGGCFFMGCMCEEIA